MPVAVGHNFLMAARMMGADFRDVMRSGDMLAEAQLAAWREFGHNVLMHDEPVCAEAEALGCEIFYQSDCAPHVLSPVLKSLNNEGQRPDPEERFLLMSC